MRICNHSKVLFFNKSHRCLEDEGLKGKIHQKFKGLKYI